MECVDYGLNGSFVYAEAGYKSSENAGKYEHRNETKVILSLFLLRFIPDTQPPLLILLTPLNKTHYEAAMGALRVQILITNYLGKVTC